MTLNEFHRKEAFTHTPGYGLAHGHRALGKRVGEDESILARISAYQGRATMC